MKKSIEKNILYGFLAIVLFAGCSSMKPLQYPELIYNHRQPLVSVTYEYGEIDIDIPIVFPGLVPDALSFEVYAKGDSIHPLLTVKSQPTDLMRVFLPQGVLGIDKKDNFIKIIPHHPDFVSLKVPFLGIDFGTTNCVCSVVINEKVILIPDEYGSFVIPSVIKIDNKKTLIGNQVFHKNKYEVSELIFSIKRFFTEKIFIH